MAEKLGRTVAELGDMEHAEYVSWFVYYARKAQRRQIEAQQAKQGR